ncbi:MAG: SPASM domain-containing protein [Clostridia bacterium]|nr:SPASM domain-containing protein [Clostridia bacterium]
MPNKAFLEITNVCNLSCSFCHGTKREGRFMTKEEFTLAATRLRPFADYLYYHLLGEPLLHPQLGEFLAVAAGLGFQSIITTNGTLLHEKGEMLLHAKSLRKVSISLHCYEANSLGISLDDYLNQCFSFCKAFSDQGKIAVMRLWNNGGADSLNDYILDKMHTAFGGEWKQLHSGFQLKDKAFLEWGDLFEWPDMDAPDYGANHSCYGLRDQVGVLCDGTVVPCCLDAEGDINLGNIFESDIKTILNSPRAKAIKRSFEQRNVTETLCRRCGYASVKRK